MLRSLIWSWCGAGFCCPVRRRGGLIFTAGSWHGYAFRSRAFDRAKKELAFVIASGAKVKAMRLMLGRASAAMTWTR